MEEEAVMDNHHGVKFEELFNQKKQISSFPDASEKIFPGRTLREKNQKKNLDLKIQN